MMKIGQILKHIRINKGVSQKKMAEELGISTNYLSLIESDKKEPSQDKIAEFANALNISKEALLLASTVAPYELNEEDKKDFIRLQKNIMSLLVFELTGKLEQHG
jgi:transcriptional regulator with XRE-family HTH domain